MAFVPQKLDTGFNAYTPERPEIPPPPKPNVSSLEGLGAAITGDWTTFNKATEQSFATIGAGFRLENDVVNTIGFLTRPIYQNDPTFDVAGKLKEDGLWNDFSDNFLGVGSEAEYDSVKGRIAQEKNDREVLEAAGAGGVVTMLAAGLISPTMVMPLVGEFRGIKALFAGVGFGAIAGAAQEIPLQLAQETRDEGDAYLAISFAGLLGGVLGGAAGFMRKPLSEVADAALFDMGVAPRTGAIPKTADEISAAVNERYPHKAGEPVSPESSEYRTLLEEQAAQEVLTPTTGRPTSAGAAAARGDAPRLADSGKMNETIGQMSPVVRVLSSGIDQARWMMAKLSDAGLEFKDNAIGAVGGTVENRARTVYGVIDKTISEYDTAHARYWYDQTTVTSRDTRKAGFASVNPKREKLSRKEFRKEVARALANNDEHEIPQVAEAAAFARKNLYDPLFKQAQEVGMFKNLAGAEGEGDSVAEILGDVSYLNRMYNIEMIQARQGEFERILAGHYQGKLEADFRKAWERLTAKEAKLAEKVEDFGRTKEDVDALRLKFEEDLRETIEGRDADLAELEDTIADKRAAARALDSGTPERKAALEEARALEQGGGEALEEVRETRATIRRRLGNLRRASSALAERQEAKLDKIGRAEDASFTTLQRLIRKGQKVLGDFDKLSDDALDAALSKLKNQFADAAAKFDRNEDRIAKVFDDDFEADRPTSPFVQAAKVESGTFDKMSEVAEAIDRLDNVDRDLARRAVQEALDDATRRAQGIVERRAVRSAKLAEQAEQLSPEAAAKRIGDLKNASKEARAKFMEDWRARGADDIDPVTGTPDFKNFAGEAARTTTNKILGTYMRLPGMDMIGNAKGAELSRTLDIPSSMLDTADGLSFLELDAEKLAISYARTMAPDIELTRVFGPDFLGKMPEGSGQLNENWKKLDDEMNAKKAAHRASMEAGVNPETGKKKTYTTEQMDKEGLKIGQEYKDLRRDIDAIISRIRNERGIPDDPRGFGARAAKIAGQVNVLRLMGGVVVSSLPDVAEPILKYGLLRTFKDGYIPFIRGLAEMKFTPQQLRIAGAANDLSMHTRAIQLWDVADSMTGGSMFEKGLDAATNKVGVLALFDYWTVAMKQIAGTTANAAFMDSLRIVAGGEKAVASETAWATRVLAGSGIDDDYARRIWDQVNNGGGEKVGGHWWPNTEDWTDPEAVMAYNAMLVREVERMIITPGVERPLMMDANPYAKLLFQFKSFGASSTTKTFLAGAQRVRQGDMAPVVGSMISLAMGTVSYYTYAQLTGGKIKEDMDRAIRDGNWGVFADEAIGRSGLIGVGADVQAAILSTPAAPYASFSGQRSTRQGGQDLFQSLAGPAYGSLGKVATNIASDGLGLGARAGDIRRILPLQNHFLLRRGFDMIEQAAGGKK